MTAIIERGAATSPIEPVEPPASTSAPSPRRPRKPGFFATSTGQKAVMAVTGAILVTFLIAHMAGNLKAFAGAESFNGYALWLREVGYPLLPKRGLLTLAEIGLVVAIALHIWSAVALYRRAAAARPVRYAARRRSQAGGYVVHIMRWGGLTIALFVVYHLLDLTFGVVNPAGGAATPYARMIEGFAPGRWYVTLFYVVAVVMVGLHLRHGLWSAFQTLGLARWRPQLKLSATLLSVALVLGFLCVPFAIMIGAVQ
ncbi:succinate dehydrogenase [Acrocarpospora phusangensis]|uniref:Succinate dehydrogenase n=1 Tax=Acrocarpospora phusangensis TaxID=1070424 RepID=A0A919UMY9_9ACTN|nr:succinate dehydrogenase cytochrome b subunit [Acrocarpospora phusangensis]GIH27886.1 succinate dehydrogenase [Acrocarpospora phusangensis]